MDKINIGKEIKVLDKGFVRLIDYMGDDSAIVQAARVSYGEGTKTVNEDRGLIRYLLRHHHTTPFEMCLAGDSKVYTPEGGEEISFLCEQFLKNEKYTNYTLSIDPVTFEIKSTKIKRVWKTGVEKVYELTFFDNIRGGRRNENFTKLRVTDNHPILMGDGKYKSIKDGLTINDLVIGGFDGVIQPAPNLTHYDIWYSNKLYRLVDIAELEEQDVYDLEVESENHNFLVDGIFVHNCEFKFHVKLPMFIARQWIRHRTACLSGDTTIKVLAKDDGTWVNTFPLKDLYERFKRDPNITIQNFNEDTQEIQYDKVLDIYESGVKQVWEWQFTGGVSIRCTKDHLVYTTLGWMKMEEVFNNREKVKVHSNIQFQKTTSSLIGKVLIGEEMTYDISMQGKHKNFYAGGIVVHNSVNEESGRYSILKDEFYVPDLDRMVVQSTTNKQGSSNDLISNPYLILGKIEMEQQHSYEQYEHYLEDGLARETARINLPLSTYTQWYWKINLHNLLHFLRLRADVHAQKEIRDYANAIIELIRDIVPLTFEAFEDYVVGSMSFSKMELSIFKHLFGENKDKILMDFDYKEMGLSKREWEEFIIKINKVS